MTAKASGSPTMLCPHCGSTPPTDAPEGLCPGCLLRGARAKKTPPKVPGYEILEELGRGGMGVVYRARQRSPDRLVALKMILAGEFAGDAELARFRTEVDSAGALDHPNIVRIYDGGGLHDGRPFFAMQLVEGGTLADPERQKPFREPRNAAQLVVTLARAVHHGHARGVLHRDLKPANVLLDVDGRPSIADFGVAKRMDHISTVSTAGILGTPGYMSPEQASGNMAVTTASDVYALGAILYELLTGGPPFSGGTLPELLRRIVQEDPVPPRKRAPRVARDLQTVCLKALEKDPARRYHSAAGFADDLERWIRGEPIAAQPAGVPGRLLRWARRYPLVAAGSVGIALLLVAVTLSALSIARVQEKELRQEVLRMNGWAARAQAGAILYQLRDYGDRVERVAAGPFARKALARAPGSGLPAPELRSDVESGGFESATIFGTDGIARARWPAPPPGYFEKSFAWRAYFQGARALGEGGRKGAYVARAFQSEADGSVRFVVSAPIVDGNGLWLGVVIVSIATDRALGKIRLTDSRGTRRDTVLLGPRDNERTTADAPLPDMLVVLAHPDLPHGSEIPVPSALAAKLRAAFGPAPPIGEQFRLMDVPSLTVEDHCDPVANPCHCEPGCGEPLRMLAGFAPVGGTGFVVAVQTSSSDASAPSRSVASRLALRVGVPLGAGLSLLLAFAIAATRRRRLT